MKKLIFALIGLALLAGLSANTDLRQSAYQVGINYTQGRGEDTPTTYRQTVALCAYQADIQVNNMTEEVYDTNGNLVYTSDVVDRTRFELTDGFTMRELHGFDVVVQTRKELGRGQVSMITSFDASVVATQSAPMPQTVSSVFSQVYPAMVPSYNRSYLANLPVAQPKLLIVSHNNAYYNTYMPGLVTWKRKLGYQVDVVYKDDMGTTSLAIKQWIQDQWDAGNRWDYCLLIGDVNSTLGIPSFYVNTGDGDDVTDLTYGLLDGDDYQPDMIVGRMSVDNITELVTVINKTVYYEEGEFGSVGDEPGPGYDWLNKALVVGGNYSDHGAPPVTPVEMSRWLYEELVANEYTQVDTFFYYGDGSGVYPGTSQISSSLSSGVGMVSYRGWGDAVGWLYPRFRTGDLLDITNSKKTPPVMSVVCNTGDFGNNTDPCFGEAWLTMGTPGSQLGGVAFTGPSFLNTRTHFNNAISSGIFWGILHEGLRNFGLAVLRGKIEVWNQYPLERYDNGYVEFYYRVYNTLGDPTVNMWKLQPERMQVEMPTTLATNANSIDINLLNVNNATVTATRNDQDFYYTTTTNGHATVLIDPELADSVTVTISSHDMIPFQKKVAVTGNHGVSLVNSPFDGMDITPGNTYNASFSLKNYGSQNLSGVSITAASSNPHVHPQNPANININAGQTVLVPVNVQVDATCPNNAVGDVVLTLSSGDVVKNFFMVDGLNFNISNVVYNNNNITFDLINMGTFAASGLTANVQSLTSALTVTSASLDLGSIASGATQNYSIGVSLATDTSPGRVIGIQLDITDASGRTSRVNGHCTFGSVDVTAPTGPDAGGYYAYDSGDEVYHSQAPTYSWVEIDPQEDNHVFAGNVFSIQDDNNVNFELPFNFRFYGHDYNQATMCDNGWVAFIDTWEINFRNWRIPAPLGPQALIAPFWDDLKGQPNGSGVWLDVRLCYYYDQPNNRFIMEWNDCYNAADDATVEKFQVILYDPAHYSTPTGDGEIVVQYHSVGNVSSSNNYATVGLQNEDRTKGLLYTFADIYEPGAAPLANQMAIKFTTVPPDNYVADDDQLAPQANLVLGNYPNPFNPTTTISFNLPAAGDVTLDVYDISGRKVRTVAKGHMPAGINRVSFDAEGLSSGVYFTRLQSGKVTAVKKMVLIK